MGFALAGGARRVMSLVALVVATGIGTAQTSTPQQPTGEPAKPATPAADAPAARRGALLPSIQDERGATIYRIRWRAYEMPASDRLPLNARFVRAIGMNPLNPSTTYASVPVDALVRELESRANSRRAKKLFDVAQNVESGRLAEIPAQTSGYPRRSVAFRSRANRYSSELVNVYARAVAEWPDGKAFRFEVGELMLAGRALLVRQTFPGNTRKWERPQQLLLVMTFEPPEVPAAAPAAPPGG